MNRRIPTPQPVGSVPEDSPILRELPTGVIVFQYTMSPIVGRQFWLDPLFWQGPAANTWLGAVNGKMPEGTEVFASKDQARAALRASISPPPAPQGEVEQTELFR